MKNDLPHRQLDLTYTLEMYILLLVSRDGGMADAKVSKTFVRKGRVGSTPSLGTRPSIHRSDYFWMLRRNDGQDHYIT
jgi:hypothetical protein